MRWDLGRELLCREILDSTPWFCEFYKAHERRRREQTECSHPSMFFLLSAAAVWLLVCLCPQQNVYYTSSQQLHLGVLSPTIDDDDNKCLVDVNSRPRLLECSYAATKHMKLTWTFSQVNHTQRGAVVNVQLWTRKTRRAPAAPCYSPSAWLHLWSHCLFVGILYVAGTSCWFLSAGPKRRGFTARFHDSNELDLYFFFLPTLFPVEHRSFFDFFFFFNPVGVLKAHLLQLDNELSHIHSFWLITTFCLIFNLHTFNVVSKCDR